MAHILASVAQLVCRVSDGFVLFLDPNTNGEALLSVSMMQFVAIFFERLKFRPFVLRMRIDGHNFHMISSRHPFLNAAGASLQG